MTADLRLGRFDAVGNPGTTIQLTLTFVDSDGVEVSVASGVKLYTGGTVDDATVLTGATAYTASITGASSNIATVSLLVPTTRTPLRMTINSVVVSVGTISPTTIGGSPSTSYTITLAASTATVNLGVATGMTAAALLTAIKTVDGAGSGLDADLLDGISSAGFALTGDARLSDTRTPSATSVTDAMIATTLSPSKITGTAVVTADSRLSDSRAPSGTAGGALSGTYPNPTITNVRLAASNVGLGTNVHTSLTTGDDNVGIGAYVHASLTTGAGNIGIGTYTQRLRTAGNNSIGVGFAAQEALTTGGADIGIGTNAQRSLTAGHENVGIGANAQYQPAGNATWATTTGLRQISIGSYSGAGSATQRDDIVTIGYFAIADVAGGVALGSGASVAAGHTSSVALGMSTVTTAAAQVCVGPRDVEITDTAKGVVLKSPNGTRWRITVGDDGSLTSTSL